MTDWTDFRRNNPEIEATRKRWNERFCDKPEPEPFNPLIPIVVGLLLVGVAFIGAIEGMIR